ncbi:unnamed protein product, partial [Amoebophrya sp. A25]|eukprot:GSA25T00018573001.1
METVKKEIQELRVAELELLGEGVDRKDREGGDDDPGGDNEEEDAATKGVEPKSKPGKVVDNKMLAKNVCGTTGARSGSGPSTSKGGANPDLTEEEAAVLAALEGIQQVKFNKDGTLVAASCTNDANIKTGTSASNEQQGGDENNKGNDKEGVDKDIKNKQNESSGGGTTAKNANKGA